MMIQDVARQVGVSVHTIRFYENTGLLPRISRTSGGMRQFSEADVSFLRFLLELKKTGMSLEEMAELTQDGCILERLQQGDIPVQAVDKRVAILRAHQQRLHEQQRQLATLINAVEQKIHFYEGYLEQTEILEQL